MLNPARLSRRCAEDKESPHPNKIPSERNSLVRAVAGALPQFLSISLTQHDSGRKTVSPVHLGFAQGCSRLAHSNRLEELAPKPLARESFPGAAIKVLGLRRTPAGKSLMSV